MTHVTVQEAQQYLPDLLAAAESGEPIEICRDDGQMFRLTASRSRPPVTGIPRAGSCHGLIEMADDFDPRLDELRDYMA